MDVERDRYSAVRAWGCRVMLQRLAITTTGLLLTVVPMSTPTPTHAADPRPACVGRVVVFASGASPCNVNPPQRLDIVGVTRHHCLDMGGSYRAIDDRCFRVDY